MGNRLLKRTASENVDYDHDACDEMSFAGDVSFKYDLKGRLISSYDPADSAERGYIWSYDDRLLYINFPDGTKSTMKYNHEGLRIYRKDKDGDITNYYWSTLGLPQVMNETDGDGNAKASYVLGLGLIAIKVSGVKKYYITDALGSILALTDVSGNVTDTYDYSEYGEITASTGSSHNPYRFTEQQYDADSGHYYLRARYYDPETGRFISRDPVENVEEIAAYVYALNRPVDLVDPTGLQPFTKKACKAACDCMYPGKVGVEASKNAACKKLCDMLKRSDCNVLAGMCEHLKRARQFRQAEMCMNLYLTLCRGS